MRKPKPSPRDNDSQNTLLGDLESIRSLLDMSPLPAVAEEEGNDVPMLEDMIDGAFTVNESIFDEPRVDRRWRRRQDRIGGRHDQGIAWR